MCVLNNIEIWRNKSGKSFGSPLNSGSMTQREINL